MARTSAIRESFMGLEPFSVCHIRFSDALALQEEQYGKPPTPCAFPSRQSGR
jgi:hypothetical protein